MLSADRVFSIAQVEKFGRPIMGFDNCDLWFIMANTYTVVRKMKHENKRAP